METPATLERLGVPAQAISTPTHRFALSPARLEWETRAGGVRIELGRGIFGTVFAAKYAGERVAAKRVDVDDLGEERFLREVSIHYSLRHPHVVTVLGAIIDASEYGTDYYIVMERLDGSLEKLVLAKDGRLRDTPIRDRLRWLHDIAKATRFYHAHGIIHGDLKPDNILLVGGSVSVGAIGSPNVVGRGVGSSCSGGLPPLGGSTSTQAVSVKVTDFGLAHIRHEMGSVVRASALGPQGSPLYMDPLLWHEAGVITKASDMYSFGIIAWQLLTGQLPFATVLGYTAAPPTTEGPPGDGTVAYFPETTPRSSTPVGRLREAVCGGKRPPLDPLLLLLTAAGVPDASVAAITSLLQRMWAADASQRPSAADVEAAIGVICSDLHGLPLSFSSVETSTRGESRAGGGSAPACDGNNNNGVVVYDGSPVSDVAYWLSHTHPSQHLKLHHSCGDAEVALVPPYVTSLDISGTSKVGDYHRLPCLAITGTALGRLVWLTSLDMSYCTDISDAVLSQLVNLTSLRMHSCTTVTDVGLSPLTKLVSLDMESCNGITDAGLTPLINLTTLNASGCTAITDAGLAPLTQLTVLHVYCCERLTDAAFRHLPSLTTLDINDCYQLTDAAVSHLSNLTALYMNNCGGYQRMTGAAISSLVNLRTLEMNDCYSVTDDTLACLTQLTTLKMNNCCEITDRGLWPLVNLTALEMQECSGVSNDSISRLKKLTHLDVCAYLTECHDISDDSVFKLANLTYLNIVNRREITDSSLYRLTNLTTLIISFCDHITDIGLLRLVNLTHLEMECATNVSDEGLFLLTSLTSLNVSRCPTITDAAIVSLLKLTNLTMSSCHGIKGWGLAPLVNLEQLDTSSCHAINDASIRPLVKLGVLRMFGCRSITAGFRTELADRGVTVFGGEEGEDEGDENADDTEAEIEEFNDGDGGAGPEASWSEDCEAGEGRGED